MLRTLFSGFVGGMPLNAVAFVPPYRPYAPGAVALDKRGPEPWERRCELARKSKTLAHRSKCAEASVRHLQGLAQRAGGCRTPSRLPMFGIGIA